MAFAFIDQRIQVALPRDFEIAGNLFQRNNDEITLMHTGMWHGQSGCIDGAVAVQQQVQIYDTRPPFVTAPGSSLQILDTDLRLV